MKPIATRQAVTGGNTHAERWRVVFSDGTRGFVKQAVDDETAEWLRHEARIYADLAGASFLPSLYEWRDDGEARPTLVLEDLGDAHWPPPWSEAQRARAFELIERLGRTRPPAWLPTRPAASLAGWEEVAKDPQPFLGLGVCTPAWLERWLPALAEAEELAAGAPSVFAHLDLRGDNLCFLGERTLAVDWSWAALAPPSADLALFALSLARELGIPPETAAPLAPCWAARLSGLYASRAGLPDLPHAPKVRPLQRLHLRIALGWLARVSGVAPPDGPGFSAEP
jgi:hypothetical protein